MRTQIHKVALIPTNKPSGLYRDVQDTWGNPIYDGKLEFTTNETFIRNHHLISNRRAATNAQNKAHFFFLYFLSDEKIKVGDWVRHTNNEVGKVTILFTRGEYEMELLSGVLVGGMRLVNAKKIIATNNPELWEVVLHTPSAPGFYKTEILKKGVPKIPISFIEAYVRENGKIDTVLLEYGYTIDKSLGHFHQVRRYFLKLKPDSSVTVHPYKSTVEVPITIIESILSYCETKQIYDKLGDHGDFYYKLKQLTKKN